MTHKLTEADKNSKLNSVGIFLHCSGFHNMDRDALLAYQAARTATAVSLYFFGISPACTQTVGISV